jgi:hypothetical protein
MGALRPDRLVRLLTGLVTLAYFVAWVGGVFLLIAVPAARLFAAGPNWHFGLELPVKFTNLQAELPTVWGPAPIKLDTVRSVLQLPIPMLPWSLVALLWAYLAAALGLGLMFLQNLRRIFQRVRDGAAFDVQNASRIRTLGVLLLSLALLQGVVETATSIVVRRGLSSSGPLAVAGGLHLDGMLIFIALVLVALAEVFRRGAELEHEQSLVV